MLTVRVLLVVGMTVSLVACSSAPTSRQLGQDAVTAMGGAERVQGVSTLTMKGGVGTRYRLGQTVKVGDAEPAATLKNVTETLDRVNNRAALDYETADRPLRPASPRDPDQVQRIARSVSRTSPAVRWR